MASLDMRDDAVLKEHEQVGFAAYGVKEPPMVMDDIDEDAPGRKYMRADRVQVLGITVDRPNGMQFPVVLISAKTPFLPFGIYEAMTVEDARRLVADLGEAIDHMEKVMADMVAKGEAEWPLKPLTN